MKCKDVVTMLFGFMNISRSRNWLVHLNTLEEITFYHRNMDRINYRRMLPVYQIYEH